MSEFGKKPPVEPPPIPLDDPAEVVLEFPSEDPAKADAFNIVLGDLMFFLYFSKWFFRKT